MAKDKTKDDKKGGKAAMATPAKSSKKDGKTKGDHGLSGPGQGGQFNAAETVGKLLLITPKRVEEKIKTSNGKASATVADVVTLDEKGKGKDVAVSEAYIFQKVVQGQLREAIANHTRVVGRLFVDKASQKKGQDAPYRLAAPTPEDIKVAEKYLDSLNPLR